MLGTIFDIKHFSIHDGPGIRQTIFFKGCPLSCWWCHNPESRSNEITDVEKEETLDGVKICDTETIGKLYSVDQLMAEVIKDIVFFEESGGGVTLSGGEPLQQHEFVLELLKECRKMEINTCVDITGNVNAGILSNIASYTDLFLYDLKHIDDVQHIKYTGVSNKQILSNLKLLDEMGKDVWIRFPLIPGINDDESDFLRLMEFLSKLKNTHPISLLPYHKIGRHKYSRYGIEYKMNGISEPDSDYILQIKNMFTNAGFLTSIGG
ncbi:MAG: glycyl-radical enzyme activating protein [Bacteroidetes bacterium]|nr:glycyl-radical enzyme activating protein [Bacteroidota bacterium]